MQSAYDKAVSLLKIRPHHSKELTRKLTMRGFRSDEVASVISKLEQEKLIDNDLFAQTLLDNLIKYKTFGFYGLKAKLMQRGLDSREAEKLLKESLSLEDERVIALRFLEKQKEPDKIKLAQKLARKGFRNEVIKELLKSYNSSP